MVQVRNKIEFMVFYSVLFDMVRWKICRSAQAVGYVQQRQGLAGAA